MLIIKDYWVKINTFNKLCATRINNRLYIGTLKYVTPLKSALYYDAMVFDMHGEWPLCFRLIAVV